MSAAFGKNRASMTARRNLLAYAQLMRLPNVFTAVADPLAGWFVVGGGGDPAWQLWPLVGASACLYTSGVIFNDCFDYEIDRRERPERPLPRGAVSRKTGWILACVLMAAGIGLAAIVGTVALGIELFLALMIFFYNSWAKRFAALGPLTLGACRFANFLLGMRAMPPRLWIAPVVVGVYVTALSFIARGETGDAGKRRLVTRLLQGIIVVDAVLVLLSPLGDWVGAALVVSLLIPAVGLGKILAMT
jgi:4-hydroxybenzoate polyprenyltransferase